MQDLLAHRPIQTGGGFIEQQNGWIAHQLHRQGQAPLLAAAEPLRCLLQRQRAQPHLVEHGLELFGRQPALTQLQFLAHAQPKEVTLGKLKDQTAEPAALAGVQRLTLPADRAAAGRGQAADQLHQGGLARAAAARHQGRLPWFERQIKAFEHGFSGRGRLVTQGLELQHGGSQVVPACSGRVGWGSIAKALPMDVRFRDVDPFNCWIWIRFADNPGQGEQGYVNTVFESLFFLGKLGAFNAENLQVHEEGADLSWMTYDSEGAEKSLPALMHNMGELEYQDDWARCWLDLGTSDGVALDVLINALHQLDKEVVEIAELVIGGVNDDWPVEEQADALFPLGNN